MNKIFLSGMIIGTPDLRGEGEHAHLALTLSVRHRTRSGETHKEMYRVNAWNNVARWGAENLSGGELVAIQGYLTQRQIQADGITATATEVTVEEFLPMLAARASLQETDDSPAA